MWGCAVALNTTEINIYKLLMDLKTMYNGKDDFGDTESIFHLSDSSYESYY